MQFKIPKFGFKFKKRGNAAGFFGAKLSIISNHLSIINDKLFQNNHLSIISNKLSQNNHLSIINDKLSKKRINYKLSIFGKKIFINYKLLIAVGVLALAGVGGTLALNGFFGGGAAIPEDTMTRGLVGYWSFDEGGGTVARDASGNNNHGTLTNGPKWTQGKNGTALQFDGKNDYVDCGNDASLNIANEMTIDMWVNVAKVGAPGGYDSIIAKFENNDYRRWYIQARAASYFGFYGRNDPGAYANPSNIGSFNFGEWAKLTLVLVKGVSTKAYVNGVQTYSGGCENYDLGNNGNLVIGGYAIPGVLIPFHGQIDEVRIYNRALTEAEVKYHYNRGGPVAQWDMDEGSGSVINDKSGNNNNGTLVNGTTWVQGKHGSALSFDGADDYAVVNDNAVLRTTGDWTRSIWVNSPVVIGGDGTTNDIWTQRTTTNKFLLRIDAAGKWALYYRSTGAGFSSFFVARAEAGVWQNIVAVKSGTSIAFYIDGKKVASATNAENFPNDSHQIYFGSFTNGTGQFFQGSIDDARIYDYARTEEEIRLDYNAGVATHLGPSGKTCSEDPAGCMDYGLAGHWDMDEGSGSVINDKSGNNNHGTLANGPKWTKGKNGGALQFDGKDDYVQTNSNINISSGNQWSVEFWIRPNIIAWKNLAGSNLGYHELSLRSNGSFMYRWLGGTESKEFAMAVSPSVNNWYHVVFVANASGHENEINVYGNGQSSITGWSTIPNGGGTGLDIRRIARSADTRFFNGKIDGVKIYNRALSAEEVRYHYNQGKPVAQWDMDEGSGSVINDKSGNGNDGTLVNGTTWAQGKHGTALSFDGVDDYVSVPNSSDLDITADESFSYSLWLKTTSTGCSSCHFLIKYSPDGYSLHFNGGGIRALVNDSDEQILSPSYQINDGNWHYVEVVFDRSTDYMSLYVDGIARSQTNIETIGSLSNLQPLSLMRYTTTYVNGQIDEVKIYDYARTEEEIRLDYNAGLATHLGPSGKTCSEDPAGCMDFGLAGHWDMDEGSGSILNDKSGNNNSCSLVNGPVWSKGKTGSALYFDGENDYADCNTAANDISSVTGTVELWAKADSGGGFPFHSNANTRTYIYRGVSGFSVSKGDPMVSINFPNTPIGEWHHLVLTWDAGVFWGYQDGVLIDSKNFSSSSVASTVRIGQHGSGGKNNSFDGDIDDVRIYNRALSEEEVRYHYNQGKPVGYWAFDEGEGTRAFDVSGNNNTGVLTNGPTWVEGKRGSALSFDGVDDYVGCGTDSSLNITGAVTVGAWVNPADDTNNRTILAKEHYDNKLGYLLHQKAGVSWMFRLYDGTSQYEVTKTKSVDLNEWQYIVGTYDGMTMKLYKNGVKIASSGVVPSLIATTGEPLWIGSRSTAFQFFNGQIDEVKVYNYARTAEQIMQDYNAGVAAHLK